MKKLLTVSLSLLFVFAGGAAAQTSTSSTTGKSGTTADASRKRGPVFRATKEQIKQAQAMLKDRGFYSGEQTAKLDQATRDGLKQYQKTVGLKSTGTLNKSTLEKMGIGLTDRQKTM
ncbi:MAG: peptidoglycan-binding domain-containing protein [Pyrinomonadaceae bacterium]